MKDTLEQNQLINEYGHTFTKAQQSTQQDLIKDNIWA